MPTSTLVYEVRNKDDIQVHTLIGFANPGGTSVIVGTTEVDHGNEDLRTSLGKGADLKGKKCIVSSVTRRIRKESEWTSVSVTISGGPAEKAAEPRQKAEPDEEVNYVTVISFV